MTAVLSDPISGTRPRALAARVPDVWRRFLLAAYRLDRLGPAADPSLFLPCGSGGWTTPEPVKGVAFLGRRTTPAGEPRLVCVGLTANGYDVGLAAYLWSPGTAGQPARLLDSRAHRADDDLYLRRDLPADRIRLDAGRADPSDPARFTIGGTDNGRPFTIVGRLTEDDRVTLRPDRGWSNPPDHSPNHACLIAGHDDELADYAPPVRSVAVPSVVRWVSSVPAITVRFTPDGRDVILAGDAGTARVDLVGGRPNDPPVPAPADAAGAAVTGDGRFVCREVKSNGSLARRLVSTAAGRPAWQTAAAPFGGPWTCGRDDVIASVDGTVTWRDAATGRERRRWTATDRFDADRVRAVTAAAAEGASAVLTIAPDPGVDQDVGPGAATAWLFAPGDDGRPPRPYRIPSPRYADLTAGVAAVLSADGHTLAVVLNDGVDNAYRLVAIDLPTGRVIRDGPIPGDAPVRVVLSPDGRLLAWTGDGRVFAADLAAHRAYQLLAADSLLSAVTFSADGRTMAAVWDGALHLWPTPP